MYRNIRQNYETEILDRNIRHKYVHNYETEILDRIMYRNIR